MANDTPTRPWLIYVDGELYGDFKTETDRERALPEARAAGGLALSHWETDGYHGPGWSEPRSEPEHEPEAEAG